MTAAVLLTANIAAQEKKARNFTVSGKVTLSSMYCGGAEPSPEELQEAMAPKAYAGKTFYIRKGILNDEKSPVITRFTSGKDGTFSLSLPTGTYAVIQREQLKPNGWSALKQDESVVVDDNCLQRWWPKPYAILEVKDRDIAGLEYRFRRACFITTDLPCVTYKGTMPPAAEKKEQ